MRILPLLLALSWLSAPLSAQFVVDVTQVATQAFTDSMNSQNAVRREAERLRLRLAALHKQGKAPMPMAAPNRVVWEFKDVDSNKPIQANETWISYTPRKASDLGVLRRSTGEPLWKVELPRSLRLEPELLDDRVIYVEKDQVCVMVDAATGKVLGRTPLEVKEGQRYTSVSGSLLSVITPVRVGGTLVLSSNGRSADKTPEGTVFGLSYEEGKIRWSLKLAGGSQLPAEPWGNSVLVGGAGVIVRLDAETGRELWRYDSTTKAEWQGITVIDGVAYVLTNAANSNLYALDVEKGNLKWMVPHKYGTLPFGSDGKRLFCKKQQRGFFSGKELPLALDVADGRLVWETTLSVDELPWFAAGGVICRSGKAIVMLDAVQGKEVWRYRGQESPAFMLIPVGDTLYNVVHRGKSASFFALNLKDGKFLWEYTFPRGYATGSLRPDGVSLLFRDKDQVLVSIQ